MRIYHLCQDEIRDAQLAVCRRYADLLVFFPVRGLTPATPFEHQPAAPGKQHRKEAASTSNQANTATASKQMHVAQKRAMDMVGDLTV